MPFTLSHAAAALPFRKFKPVWPALVVGTFAPDLQYFIWISDEDRTGHHFPEAVLFTLPLAVLVLWVFEWWVKGPVIELLHSGVQRRLHDKVEPLSFKGWKQFASIVLWTAVGIATHVIWDQFTHYHTWMNAHWGVLHYTVPVPFHDPVSLPKILQHLSTIVGFLVVAAWCAFWYGRTTPVPEASLKQLGPFRKIAVVLTMAAIAVVTGYPLAIVRLADHPPPIKPLVFIVTVFEAMTLLFCVQVLIYSVARVSSARFRRASIAVVNGPGS
jgi:hypothetical protein